MTQEDALLWKGQGCNLSSRYLGDNRVVKAKQNKLTLLSDDDCSTKCEKMSNVIVITGVCKRTLLYCI